MSFTSEIWKEVPGYDGWYEASNQGRVRSWRGLGNNQVGEAPMRDMPLIMKQSPTRGGYLFVALSKDGAVRQWRLNRLILTTFLGEEPELEACHDNGNRTDNRLSNLRWDTPQANSEDKRRHGTAQRGEDMPSAKLTDEAVLELRQLWFDPSRVEGPIPLGAKFGVSGPTAWRAAVGRTWTHLPMPEGASDA